jgi:transcriptional regulator with XRE-family HTH domain
LTPEELQRLRLRLDLTQTELANHLGVARNTVTRWETGARKIAPPVAIAIRAVAQRLRGRAR